MDEFVALKQLSNGQMATIAHIDTESDTGLERQCLAMGLVPGSSIKVLTRPSGKGPMQVKCQGSYYAIRALEAEHIFVEIAQ